MVKVREGARWISEVRVGQAEGTASAKALRWECALCVAGTARSGQHRVIWEVEGVSWGQLTWGLFVMLRS